VTVKLIGVTGYAQAGKDAFCTCVHDLVEGHGDWGAIIALAAPLKRVCFHLFSVAFPGVNAQQFYGSQNEKNKPIEGIPGWTGRQIAQHIGTEGFRAIHPDVWINYALAEADKFLRADFRYVLFSDVRFQNEANRIKAEGGIVVRIKRPCIEDQPRQGIANHASEAEIDTITADYVINNDGSLNDLQEKARNLLCQLQYAPLTRKQQG